MNKVFLDTNVLIYAIDQDSCFHLWARRFFNDGNIECVTSSKNISEFLAVTTKGEEPSLTINDAVAIVKILTTNCALLYPDSVSSEIFMSLLLQHKVKGLLVHDYEIASIALSNDIKVIATANRKDFQKIEGLQLIVP
jgi:predicted nucleic acid-binding protein